MPTHPVEHLFWTLAFLATAAVFTAVVRSRLIKRRLLFSEVLFLIALAAHAAIREYPATRATLEAAEYFLITFGAISAVVTLVLNPWYRERQGDGVPAIVQDTITAVLVGVASLFVFQSASYLAYVTGSAIVLGFALQDTLGNAFAGLAIQIERPFRVGHWITAAEHEGRVVEITWRATKIETKGGDLVVLPNSVVAQQAIHNYSVPSAATRLFVDVGVSYETPPNDARGAILDAVRRVGRVLATPPPEVLLLTFADSAITYRVQFWITDFARDDVAKSDVGIAIYYELRRRSIEIPWPIQIQYTREEPKRDSPELRDTYRRTIAAVPVLASLPDEAHRALAAESNERLFGDGEVIVREGDAGRTMFVVREGRVAITIGADARLVATTEEGGYFGEMSLLTGDPRSATVTAQGDTTVLEIDADAFRAYVHSHPAVIDQLAAAAAQRRLQLDANRAASAPALAAERTSLAQRMRKFFGLD
ncbi:MAG TPA: cyclic nucleotide-binding domain-containing protein [Vicinamibacterales bacterium]|nr:cyclic nucleotide-binding domain-containing protein [Vicinamibacterales bacterium]